MKALGITMLVALPLIAGVASAQPSAQASAEAIFAGGCFWCMEPPYDKLDGVASTTSGYIGGRTESPTYEQVSSGTTGHTEAVRVVYDPARVSYETLLEVFWRNIDPLDAGGQFCDRGDQYRSAIFYAGEAQKRAAERSKAQVHQVLGADVVTEVEAAGPFYTAEEYHQDYYQKNPIRYQFYRFTCGRDDRLDEIGLAKLELELDSE